MLTMLNVKKNIYIYIKLISWTINCKLSIQNYQNASNRLQYYNNIKISLRLYSYLYLSIYFIYYLNKVTEINSFMCI